MRASLSDAADVHSQGSAELAAERATKASYLLREALALLANDPQNVSLVSARRQSDRLLRLPEVQRLTGLRRSAIYEQMQKGMFPRTIKAGLRAATWSEAAIQTWISDRIGSGSD